MKNYTFRIPEEIKELREALSLSCREFGATLGLVEANSARTVMRWEAGEFEPSTPIRNAMTTIAQALWGSKYTPEFIESEDNLIRLHYPRFVAKVYNDGNFEVLYWIDLATDEAKGEALELARRR